MALYLYKNGTWSWNGTPNRVTTPSLCYYQNNAINYLPLITKTGTLTLNGKLWSYTTAVPTFHVVYNSTEYVVPNKYEDVTTYDIAPGTYTPSAFENLIKSFISQNGSRAVSNSFSVVVNGQTYSVPAGRAIYYTYQYSGQARFVCFNGSPRGDTDFQNGFSTRGVYCTYWSLSQSQGDRYYQYSIKVNTGIKFK